MQFEWKLVSEHPPLHSGLECLVCTQHGHLLIAEYHSEPEGWVDALGNEQPNVKAYILLWDIPRPMRGIITNDEWVSRLKDQLEKST